MAGILCPTDFSVASNNALDFAIEIAKRKNIRLVLFNAYQVYVADTTSVIPELTVEALHENVIARLEKLKTELLQNGNLNIEVAAGFGFTADTILEATEDLGIDYVVMGTTGASAISRVLMGSTAASCIEKLKVPVIAVPENAQFRGLDRIVFASGLHKDELPSLEKLNVLLEHFGTEVTIAHTFAGSDKDAMEFSVFQELAEAKLFNCKTHFRQFSGEVIEGIEQAIRLQKTDALAMVAHHRVFFKKLFDSSITKKMVYHTDVPLIAFQA